MKVPDAHLTHLKLELMRRETVRTSNKEDIMLDVTPAATEQIAAYFKDKEIRPIRIFLNEGG